MAGGEPIWDRERPGWDERASLSESPERTVTSMALMKS